MKYQKTELKGKRLIIFVVSCVATVGALIYTVIAMMDAGEVVRPKRRIKMTYYYDTGTKKLFEVDPNVLENIPPIAGPSGKPAFRAWVFACGDCSNPENRFIAMLEAFTDKARKMRLEADKREIETGESGLTGKDEELIEAGHQVARWADKLEDLKWHSRFSDQGMQIIESTGDAKSCPKGKIRSCMP